MDPDAFKIVGEKLSVIDVANIAVAMCDQDLIRERKQEEFDKIFTEKMRSLWFGRFNALLAVYTRTCFWSKTGSSIWATTGSFRERLTKFFYPHWDVDLCGGKLHMNTRILDEIVSIAVNLHAPFHSARSGDRVHFKFDIIHSSRPIDIDAYAPDDPFMSAITAMNDAMMLKSEQIGTLTNAGLRWDRFVTALEMQERFENSLDAAWKKNADGAFYVKTADDVTCRMKFLSGFEFTHGKHKAILSFQGRGFDYSGPLACVTRGAKGTLTRKMFAALKQFNAYSAFHSIWNAERFKIKIRLDGKDYEFVSWGELHDVSGISFDKLRVMATAVDGGVFINFDTHTFRRKKISFVV
jgi:hypothetical protein